jgi:hypothetical protein
MLPVIAGNYVKQGDAGEAADDTVESVCFCELRTRPG